MTPSPVTSTQDDTDTIVVLPQTQGEIEFSSEVDVVEYNATHVAYVVDDNAPMSPEDYCETFGVIAAYHSRYDLGHGQSSEHAELQKWLDNAGIDDPTELADVLVWEVMGFPFYTLPGTNGVDEEPISEKVERFCKAEFGSRVVLPVYLLDHSGLRMNTEGFSCSWDSGRVGWVFDTQTQREEWGYDYTDAEVAKALRETVALFDSYVSGDTYGIAVAQHENGEILEEVDSCWGFYGYDSAVDEAKSLFSEVNQASSNHEETLV